MNIFAKAATALLAAATAITATPALAQQTQPAPQRPDFVTQFDNTMVTNLLRDVQATWQVEQAADGSVNYRAQAEGGLNFTLAPRACSQQNGCLGLMMLAVYTGVNTQDLARLDAFLNQLNDSSATVKVFRNPQGVVILQGYINAAGGITYRNTQAQLLLFGEDIVNVSRALAQFEQQG